MKTNIHEQHARLVKSLKLADNLFAHGITSSAAERMTEDQWNKAAIATGVNKPGEQTCRMVIERLKADESAAARNAHRDPFAGFGGAA